MEIWKYEITNDGNMELWKYGIVEIYNCGQMELWKHGFLETGKLQIFEIGNLGN